MDIQDNKKVWYATPFNVDAQELVKDARAWKRYIERVTSLPNSFIDVISSIRTAEYFLTMEQEQGLREDQKKDLLRLTRDILLVETYLGDIIGQIEARLKVDPQKAKEIASLVVNRVLQPILGELKEMHIKKFGPQKSAEQSVPPHAPSTPNMSKQGGGMDDKVVNLRNQKV